MTPTPEVVSAAQAAQTKWKIPASITIAQYGLESGWGQHMPPGSNNPFGIKSLSGLPSVTTETHEYIHGHMIEIPQAFAVFPNLAAAFNIHAQLLATSAYYANARTKLPDPYAFANALTGVYATDTNYGTLLGEIIRGDNLTRYDA